jgi:Mg-chelatase subunit ChlD
VTVRQLLNRWKWTCGGLVRPRLVDGRIVVQLVDSSLSMGFAMPPQSRLDAARRAVLAFTTAANRGPERVHIAVVGFAQQAMTVLELGDATDLDRVAAALSRLTPSPHTNIEAGLCGAERILKPYADRAGLEVHLLSDGGATDGNAAGPAKRLKAMGCLISCVGIGSSPIEVDADTLRSIASKRDDGTPMYRFITDGNGLVRAYAEHGFGLTRS